MNVLIVKLISGEEVIGDVRDDGSYGIYIKNPAILAMMQSAQGPQLAMGNWLPFKDEKAKEVRIKKEVIITMYEPNSKLVSAYNEQFGSGLVLPSKGLITG